MKSIRTRLLLWLMVPLSIVAGIVSVETFSSAQSLSKDLHDRTLRAAMLTLSENIVASSGTLLAESTLDMLTNNLGDEFFYYVRGPQGAFVTGYSSYPRLPEGVSLQENIPVFYDGEYNGQKVRVIAMQQFLVGRDLNGSTTITTWQKNTTRNALTLKLFAKSLLRLVLLVLAAGAIVWFAITKGLMPITDLQNAIENRTPHDLTPIKRQMPIELSGIVASMNELFGRVAASKANREKFIGNAAHQLRNPMAAIKVQAQAAIANGSKTSLKEALESIVATTDNTGKMINQMLSSASAHALARDNMQEFDLAAALTHVTRSLAPLALDRGQEISLLIKNDSVTFLGHEVLLREAMSNLIDNAITHNQPGTSIDVTLVVSAENGDISIDVKDDGDAFGRDALIELSQPFTVGKNAGSGTGLGLSLAKDVAKSHGGYLNITTQAGQVGKTISIILPKGGRTISA